MKKSELSRLVREEIRKTLNEAVAPAYKAKHRRNNLVASIYFGWRMAELNDSSFWNKVMQIIQQEDCKLVNYVVTETVCEFEFIPSEGVQSQDQLEDAKNRVEDALKPLMNQWMKYDVYISGN